MRRRKNGRPAEKPGVKPLGFVRMNIGLTPKQHETLHRLAQERGTSAAALIRQAIAKWLETEGDHAQDR